MGWLAAAVGGKDADSPVGRGVGGTAVGQTGMIAVGQGVGTAALPLHATSVPQRTRYNNQ